MGENDSTVIVPLTARDRKLNKVLQLSSKCVSSEVGDMKRWNMITFLCYNAK